MALLTGMTADGVEVPVQVLPDGKLVAEGLEGKEGPPGNAAVISGTAALPGLHPPGDLDTGLWSPGPDQLAMSFGGVPWLFFSPGQIGIGEASPSKNPVVRFGGQLGGSTTRGVFTLSAQVMRDVTTAARGYATYLYTEPAPFKTGAFYHFLSEQGPLGAQSAVDTQFGFTASSSLVGAITNYGFFADLPAGTSRWNFYSRGTADSWFASNNFIFANGGQEKARFDANGYLLLGRGAALPVTAAKLQISGTANLSVVAYSDNTAAIGAGLVPGDIYRKPDGTLMITY